MLLVSIGSFAQTTVEFVAGTDKGNNTKYDWKGSAGDDEVVVDGVRMHSNNATFAADKYSVKNIGWTNKTLAFTSQKNIVSIEFKDGESLGKLEANGFDASAAKWTGKATEVSFTVKGEAKFSQVIVTMESKPATTLEFDQSSVINYIELGKTSNAPAVTLKGGENVLTGLALTYESSNTDVATVDGATGMLTPKAVGTATITAKFAGNDEYEGSEAQFTFNVVDGKNIFHETFDNMDGEGGNDGNFGLTGSMFGNLSGNLSKCDNESWTTPSVNSNGKADKCVRIEMSSSITTPALSNLSGDAFLMFRAAQNRGTGTSISLSISGGGQLEQTSVSLEKAFNDYTILVRNATPQTKITFSCSAGGCFYLDDVKIERAIVLDENADNNDVLEDNQLEPVNVAFKRALSSEYWNTICLPFNVEEGDVAEIFGEGTVVKAFKGWDAANSTLNFENAKAMEAGIPYLIKPGLTVSAFMFEDETVHNTVGAVSSNGVTFQGTLNATVLEANDVFIGTDGVLYRPDTETAGSDRMLGFRAYFKGIDPAVNAKVNFDGTATSISQIATGAQTAGKVYTIDGRYVGTSTEGLAKGLYIAGGKKVVVK